MLLCFQYRLRVRTARVISEAEQLAKTGELDKAEEEISNWIEEFEKEKFEIGSPVRFIAKHVSMFLCFDLALY